MAGFKPGGFKKHGGGGFRGNGPHFGGKRPFDRDGGQGDRQMHSATCAECGRPCEVPFRPGGDRPVYCRDCFSTKRDAPFQDRGPRPQERSFPRPEHRPAPAQPSFDSRPFADTARELSALNTKLTALLGILERTYSSRPAQAPQQTVVPAKAPAPAKIAAPAKAVPAAAEAKPKKVVAKKGSKKK